MVNRIGELSAATGVSIRLLRYYEERGLLNPERSASGQRLYRQDAIERVVQIRRLLAAGLTTDRIHDLLPCLDAPPRDRTDHLLHSLREERRKLDTARASLDAAASLLDALIDEVFADASNIS